VLTRTPARPDPEALLAPLASSRGIVLAVSGGPDSLALLALADSWRKGRAIPVSVATVDHGLRAESRAEAEAVAAICRAKGLGHTILAWTGQKPATGLPAAARAARYALLGAHALRLGADTIVTAHHADDQAETVLMRLTRGSGPAGLAGMAAFAPVPGHEASGLRLARPLLATPKADLVALCHAEGLRYFEDPTNTDEAYRRPQVRELARQLSAQGLGRDEILRLAARAARAEQALAALVADRLAALPARREPDLFEAEAAAIDALPQEALIRLLAGEIARLTGAAPRLERLEALVARLGEQAPVAATLGGVSVRGDAKRLVLKPQPPRRRPS
jgi:tRNA(Ile)-lysidine synthase